MQRRVQRLRIGQCTGRPVTALRVGPITGKKLSDAVKGAEKAAVMVLIIEKQFSTVNFEWLNLQKTVILMNVNPDIRWKQRFENYERALMLLRKALSELDKLSQLEKEGVAQRFEFTVELAWKTLKDYLENTGVVLGTITPGNVVKQAFAAKIITDGQLWVDMLRCRNRLSHTYDEAAFDQAVHEIKQRFLAGLDEIYGFLKKRIAE